MRVTSALICILMSCALRTISAQSLTTYAYDIGTPTLTDYYVDPVTGSDSASGLSQGSAWKTVQHAWGEIPESSTLTHGYRINLMNGSYGNDELPNYWELRRGTQQYPIILRAAPGQNSVTLVRDINMANVSYFYLINVTIAPTGGGDAFHCESCNHILLRGNTLNGGSKTTGAHETVKINQSQYIYIENNNIAYADDNNIDFVGVQYGHVIGNKVHEAADWCMYVKGGSAYIRIEANEFYNCGTGGFTAGQGSGFQFMTSPWLHYEAYDIKFINNVIYNTDGAAFGVNGGYNILLAHNTAYNVGGRNHLVEVVFGERTCDGESDGQSNATCAAFNSAGGWGPSRVNTTPEPIGNKNVSILNNLIYNPPSLVSPQHFAIYGPRTASASSNLSTTQYADTNVVIKGNVLWNGTSSTLYGIEESDQGCQSSNPTCSLSQIIADNSINMSEPLFKNLAVKDLRPLTAAALLSFPTTLTSFSGGDRPTTPATAEGVLDNNFTRDLSGATISGTRLVGAYGSPDSALTAPVIDESDVPSDPTQSISAPTLGGLTLSAKRSGKKVTFTISVKITSNETPSSVSALLTLKTKQLGSITLKSSSGTTYKGKKAITVGAGKKVSVSVMATNSAGSTVKSKRVKTP